MPRDIIDDVKNEFGVDVPYMKAYRAKEKAVTKLRGKPTESYKKLSGYVHILDKMYPGSHIRMKKSSENKFLYLFVALYTFIKGFDCCRPIVVVDGGHIKTAYNRAFVSASTMDHAGNILPLAYGVIDSENDKSWTWFFEQFKEAYAERENMCVVSDHHESIINAVSKIYPNVPHFACIWYLWKNVYNKYRKSHKVLSRAYYALAKAYTQNEFDMLMAKVEKVDIRVKNYLEEAGREKWARLYAPVNRAWTMTSHIAESINSSLVDARELPIFEFLEEVRLLFGHWNCTNRQNGSYTSTTLGRKFNKMLSVNKHKSVPMKVIPSTEFVHTVIDEGQRFIVCIEKKTCSCKEFQMEEIPCPHAWVVLKKKNIKPDNNCSEIYKPDTVIKPYDVPIYPPPDESNWKMPGYILEDLVLPSRFKRQPGRPKKKRDNSLAEWFSCSRINSCSRCGYTGHNRRSYRNEPRRK